MFARVLSDFTFRLSYICFWSLGIVKTQKRGINLMANPPFYTPY